MKVEAGRDAEVSEWLASRGVHIVPPFVTLAMVDEEKIIAAAVFNNYQFTNIDMSIVFERTLPLTRAHLRALFSYPFKQAGVRRISVRTSMNPANLKVRKLIRRLGFRPEGKQPEFFGADSAICYGMRRHECKWIK